MQTAGHETHLSGETGAIDGTGSWLQDSSHIFGLYDASGVFQPDDCTRGAPRQIQAFRHKGQVKKVRIVL